MFHVTLINLTADARSAFPGLEPHELGELGVAPFVQLLGTFAALDPVQNSEAEPQLMVSTRAGKFIVRTDHGKFILYNARDSSQPGVEFPVEELLEHLGRTLTTTPFVVGADAAAARPAPHGIIAVAMLAVGLALNGYTLYSVVYTESVNVKPAIALITDPAEVAAQRTALAGAFFTGRQAGDRGIIIAANGGVRFTVFGAPPGKLEGTDTFLVGHHDNRLCLDTPDSGVIDVVNLDTLIYYRDTYSRQP